MRNLRKAIVGLSLGTAALAWSSACDREGHVSRANGYIDLDATIVIRQVFGGGSNSGAPFTHDFVELFNRGTAPASLAGWSVQYASATGTGNFGASTTQLTELPDVTLAPGQSFLIQEGAQTTLVGAPLPTPDLIDASPIAMSATGGKLALARQATTLGCNGSSSSCAGVEGQIVDLVGYGSANYAEGTPTAATTNTTSAQRVGGGCTDTNDNQADFVIGAPEPRNSQSPVAPCTGGGSGTGGGGGGASGGAGGDAVGGAGGAGGAGGSPTPGAIRIHDIQGRAHRSPLEGTTVTNVPGIVTVVRSNGFYMQDDTADGDPGTSEGIFVFTSAAPSVAAGDLVLVTGPVSEFRPGCSGSCSPSASAYDNLTTTELDRPSAVVVMSQGNPLPAPTRIGAGPGGRMPPTTTIDQGATPDVESPTAVFAPDSDGIDFYESLEGMLVELRDTVVVGPTNAFGEIPVLVDGGAAAGLRTARGGIVVAPGDFNPERVILDGDVMPSVNVGDTFPGTTVAVVDYSFGNFKLAIVTLPASVPGGLVPETQTLGAPAANQLSVATFNVENLDPTDPPKKFADLAAVLVNNLGAPDLVSLEEVQDNNGALNDGTVGAQLTLQTLVDAIQVAGGPAYQYRSIDPVDGQDGGEPGGNIRVAFLFRTDRGLSFVDRPGAGPTTANAVVSSGGVPALAFSPGRIDPTNAAFANSRKPLAGELRFNGRTLFAVANHFNSKGGDDPLFGRFQPPVQSSQTQRTAQATVVATFVNQLRAVDPNALVVVLGDLNDFEFSAPVGVLKAAELTPLIETLPPNERYTYVYDGNSQVLDHVMVSPALLSALAGFDVVHVNAEFTTQVSDHDPALGRFNVGSLPTQALIPILECVVRNGTLSWTARFGYDNPNALAVARPVGSGNRFVPAPTDRGQPTLFQPGRQRAVFEVAFRPLQPAIWLLDGRLETGTILSPRCP